MSRRSPAAWPWIVALSLSACGARSGLDVEPPDAALVDAALVDAADSGFFRTFPCLWTFGEPLTVATAASFSQLTGAVHPTADVAVIGATAPELGPRLWSISLGRSPAIREERSGPMASGPWFAGVDGFLQQIGRQCVVRSYDVLLAEGELFEWVEEMARCELTQTEPGRIESASVMDFANGSLASVGPLPSEAPEVRRLGDVGPQPERAHVHLAADGEGALTVWQRGDEVFVQRRGGEPRALASGPGARFESAPERLRGAVLVLSRDASRPWTLERHEFAGGPSTPVVDVGALPAEPVGAMRSNETEALIPLGDGSMAHVPLAGAELRSLGPVPEGPVEAMEIILRPGGSAGGLLYVHGSAAGRALTFRALICNR